MANNLISKIRTDKGDCQIDYNALANRPSSLKNPYALTFTGAALSKYDGSTSITVNIPTVPEWANQDSNPSYTKSESDNKYATKQDSDEKYAAADQTYTKDETDARYAPISAAIRPTVSGNPAVCEDSVAWSFQGLKVYGKSTQDGTPSPENPVPIVSSGDGGSLSVDLSSNQLLDYSLFNGISQNGITARTDEFGRIILNGTATNNSFLTIDFVAKSGEKIKIKAYNPVGNANVGIKCSAKAGNDATNIVYLSEANTLSELDFKEESTKLTIRTSIGSTLSNFIIRPMLYKYGDGTWEPYNDSQSFTISTPNGLPGIPVKSGGNFTDVDGQQLVCDVVDYSTLKKVSRVYEFHINSSMSFALNTSNENFVQFTTPIDSLGIAPNMKQALMCNRFKPGSQLNEQTKEASIWIYTESEGSTKALYLAIVVSKSIASTVGELKTWISENKTVVLLPLATPIETDISAEELAAYRALTTYGGTTVVSTAEPVAGIEARYVADGTKYLQSVTDRIAALEAAQTSI